MAKVFFISEALLKSKTAINDNVDSGELRFCIELAEDINIQETLGQKLYDRIQADVQSNTITGNYKKLLDDYIVPATILWAYYHALDNFLVKFMNVGLVQNNTEQGQSIDLRTFQFLKNNARSQAEWYDDAMRKYLCAYSSDFPEYNTVEIGKILPKHGSAFRNSMAMKSYPYLPYWYGPIVRTQGSH